MLDISKIEAGQLAISLEPVDVAAVLNKAIRTTKPLAERKNLTLELECAEDVGMVSGDLRRIEQVILNLLSNAIKFTETGSVRVECSKREDMVMIRVIDTGIGIQQADIETIFKPFSQLDTGLTRQYEGTGLGLSITKKLLDMMRGQHQC